MRTTAAIPLLILFACTTAPAPVIPASKDHAPGGDPKAIAEVHGFTVEEEARILELEDRRMFDPPLAEEWMHHPNALHRARMALALGRIGPHTFADANGNAVRDAGEHQAGVDLLAAAIHDPDPNVRVTTAFALGQIGDPAGADALMALASDAANGDVAAEAVEALSKLGAKAGWSRYAPFTEASQREGVRARAIRFLFRFKSDEAMAIAASALESPSPLMRQEGSYALARLAHAPARSRLELLLADPLPQIRANAASALGRIGSAESIDALIRAISDPQPWVRTNAVVAITRIAAKDAHAIDRPQISQDALKVLDITDDPDSGTRASAIETLGVYATRNELAKKRLVEIAANGSRWNRELAAGAIARHLRDATLLPANLSGWAKVRVLEATGVVSDSMRERFARDPEAMVRANAISTIGDDKVDANFALVRTALDDPDAVVRGYALDRLGHSSDSGKLAKFQQAEAKARSDSQNDARLNAIRGIAETAHPQRDPFLRSLLSDADPVVQRLAADLIEQKLNLPRPQYTPLPSRIPQAQYARIVEWARRPHTATIRMTRGDIELVLLSQDAPMTTWNFAQLAQKHYFDRSSFMRVVPNFVIQGGDPRNDMEGGPGYSIRDEINLQKYTRGALGMALSGPDTGGSQFFITHSPQPHLDGGYTIFGRVSGGMAAVADQTERGDQVETILIDQPTAKRSELVAPASLPAVASASSRRFPPSPRRPDAGATKSSQASRPGLPL
ncbi:MAG: HEAT repeat domain-containing protein [Thermoanaerobaculia bacterium]